MYSLSRSFQIKRLSTRRTRQLFLFLQFLFLICRESEFYSEQHNCKLEFSTMKNCCRQFWADVTSSRENKKEWKKMFWWKERFRISAIRRRKKGKMEGKLVTHNGTIKLWNFLASVVCSAVHIRSGEISTQWDPNLLSILSLLRAAWFLF